MECCTQEDVRNDATKGHKRSSKEDHARSWKVARDMSAMRDERDRLEGRHGSIKGNGIG